MTACRYFLTKYFYSLNSLIDTRNALETSNRKNVDLRQEIGSLNADLKRTKDSLSDYVRRTDTLNRNNDDLKREVGSLNADVKRAKDSLSDCVRRTDVTKRLLERILGIKGANEAFYQMRK